MKYMAGKKRTFMYAALGYGIVYATISVLGG